jgi:hypothetical protein
MKTSFAYLVRAVVLAACALGMTARSPKSITVDDFRNAGTPK